MLYNINYRKEGNVPPKPRVTKDMIVDAAVEVIRAAGVQSINARSVATQLGCSTQPVMYQFATMEELKQAAYERVDRLHTDYLLSVSPEIDPLLGMGLNYIRFAKEEPQLFCFLFQSGYVREHSLLEMIDSPELRPILKAIHSGSNLDEGTIKDVFLTLALFVHGYASLVANNSIEFDESQVAPQLKRVFVGAVAAVSKGDVQ